MQQQITTTTATHSLWDITTRYGDVLLETSYSGSTPNAKVSYTYGQACGSCSRNPVAELISQKKGASSPEYFLLDGQGSVRGLTSNSGMLVTGSEFSYDTFGKPTAGDVSKSSYLYTGQQYDAATELYSLRARYYSPQQGRFLSRDTWPVDFQNPMELNRYAYTANNPVNYSDPSGYSFDENSKINQSTGALEGLAGSRLRAAVAGSAIGVLVFSLIFLVVLLSIGTMAKSECSNLNNYRVCVHTFNTEATLWLGTAFVVLAGVAGALALLPGLLLTPAFPAAIIVWALFIQIINFGVIGAVILAHASLGGYIQIITKVRISGISQLDEVDIGFCRTTDKQCGDKQRLYPK